MHSLGVGDPFSLDDRVLLKQREMLPECHPPVHIQVVHQRQKADRESGSKKLVREKMELFFPQGYLNAPRRSYAS